MSLPLPVASLVDLFGVGLTLERAVAGAVDEYGESVPDAATVTTITGAVHPASWKDLQRLPEGDRGLETIAVYTKAALKISASSSVPDVLVYRGRRYQVTRVADYELQGGVYLTLAQLKGGLL